MGFTNTIAPRARGPRRPALAVPLMSLEKFDRATLEEARKVLAGTSRWFTFTETGDMKVLHPFDSPEQQAPRAAEEALQNDVIARPDFYRAELARLKKGRPKQSDYLKSCLARRKELRAQRDAIDPFEPQLTVLLKKGFKVYAQQERARDPQRIAALEQEERAINSAMADLSRQQDAHLSDADKARLKDIDLSLYIVEREQIKSSREYLKEQHTKSIEQLEQMLKTAEFAEQYAPRMAALTALVAQVPALRFNPMRGDDWKSADAADRKVGYDLQGAISTHMYGLERAAATMPDASARIDAIEALVVPLGMKSSRMRRAEERTRHADMDCDAFTPQRRIILQATIALIARAVQAPTQAEAQQAFNERITFIAHSDYDSEFVADLRDQGRAGQEWIDRQDRHLHPLGERVERVHDYLQQFEAVARGDAKGMDAEELSTLEYDLDEWHAEKDWHNPHRLIREATNYARLLRHDDYMKLHNQFPDAVNFIRASAESEFLLDYRDTAQPIADAASFFDSAWVHLLGNAELRVDPTLLEAARMQLQGSARTYS